MFAQLRPALVAYALLTLVTGVAYPLVVTAIGQLFFSSEANGSLRMVDGKTVGSTLIGQPFSDPRYFFGRPSATAPFPYNAASSSGSNLGPTNPTLIASVKERVTALRKLDPTNDAPIPIDLVTASASGLDPHVSPAAALYQVPRVARLRQISPEKIRHLVNRHTEGRTLGILGEPRVNVLLLNLDLDALR